MHVIRACPDKTGRRAHKRLGSERSKPRHFCLCRCEPSRAVEMSMRGLGRRFVACRLTLVQESIWNGIRRDVSDADVKTQLGFASDTDTVQIMCNGNYALCHY